MKKLLHFLNRTAVAALFATACLCLPAGLDASEKRVERWYGDNNLGNGKGAPVDFRTRLTNTASWDRALKIMDAFSIKEASWHAAKAKDPSIMKDLSDVLRRYRIPIHLDTVTGMVAHGQKNPEFKTTVSVISSFRSNSIELRYVSLQSVLSAPEGKGQTGKTGLPVNWGNRYQVVVDFFKVIRPLFPGIQIGIIDAMPAQNRTYTNHYLNLKKRLADAGYALDYIILDYPIDSALTGTEGHTFVTMIEAARFIREKVGCRAGLYLVSKRGGNESDVLFRTDVLDGLNGYLKAGGNPDFIALDGWYPFPKYSVPDEVDPAKNPYGATHLGTFRLVDGILRAHGQ